MANLYLLDRPFGRAGIDLALRDRRAKAVLIQDGAYLDCRALLGAGVDVYVVGRDLERRGLVGRVAAPVRIIDHGGLVDLIVEHKVVNFA